MNILDADLIEETLKKARGSPRRRAIYCFHGPGETLQRMINAGLADTYARPHKHEDPDKLEIFLILHGKVGILFFGDEGDITEKTVLDDAGPNYAAEIPPRTWHSFIILSPEAAVYELIEGRFNPKTHKNYAPWAPAEEDEAAATDYLLSLKQGMNL